MVFLTIQIFSSVVSACNVGIRRHDQDWNIPFADLSSSVAGKIHLSSSASEYQESAILTACNKHKHRHLFVGNCKR